MDDHDRPQTSRTAMLSGILAAGIGVGLIVWQADTLRITLDRTSFAFASIVAFGLVHGAARRVWPTTGALLFGSSVAITSAYVALDVLPLTPAGRALGLAFGAFFAAMILVLPRVRLPYGAVATGFGVGVAAFELSPVATGVGLSDLVATASATGFAVMIGAAGAMAWDIVHRRFGSDDNAEGDDEAPTLEIGTVERSRVRSDR